MSWPIDSVTNYFYYQDKEWIRQYGSQFSAIVVMCILENLHGQDQLVQWPSTASSCCPIYLFLADDFENWNDKEMNT